MGGAADGHRRLRKERPEGKDTRVSGQRPIGAAGFRHQCTASVIPSPPAPGEGTLPTAQPPPAGHDEFEKAGPCEPPKTLKI